MTEEKARGKKYFELVEKKSVGELPPAKTARPLAEPEEE